MVIGLDVIPVKRERLPVITAVEGCAHQAMNLLTLDVRVTGLVNLLRKELMGVDSLDVAAGADHESLV